MTEAEVAGFRGGPGTLAAACDHRRPRRATRGAGLVRRRGRAPLLHAARAIGVAGIPGAGSARAPTTVDHAGTPGGLPGATRAGTRDGCLTTEEAAMSMTERKGVDMKLEVVT